MNELVKQYMNINVQVRILLTIAWKTYIEMYPQEMYNAGQLHKWKKKNSSNRKLGKTYRKYNGDTLPDTKTRGKNPGGQKTRERIPQSNATYFSSEDKSFQFSNLKLGYNSWWLSRRRDSEN